MRAAIFHGPGDIRIENVPDPRIEKPTDAVVRITHTAICGSDLWFYRGESDYQAGWRTGHEPMGVVEAVGRDVRTVKPGDLVLAPFAFSDGTCEFCRKGLHGVAKEGLDIMGLFFKNLLLRGGPAPVRAYMEELMDDVLAGELDPSPIFDLRVDLAGIPEGYAAMDQRRALKVLVTM